MQPVDPLNEWTTLPFEPTVRDGEMIARGAADDKGQVFMHLKAIEAWMKQTGGLPVNLKMIIEGEEDVGSRNLDDFIDSREDLLAADVVVISDTAMFDRGVLHLLRAARSRLRADRRARLEDRSAWRWADLADESGDGVGAILAQMKDKRGRIKIPGFYDDVRELSEAERAEYTPAAIQREELPQGSGSAEADRREGLLDPGVARARPTLGINGLLSGFTGTGAKTVLPAVAMAKVSMRLVPDQDPEKIAEAFEKYVLKVAPKSVEVKVTRMHGGAPWKASLDNPYVRAAARAIETGFGATPVFTREGGSIPVVASFQRILGLPSVLFGVGLPDDRIHAPNEKLDLANFHNGIVASAVLYEEIAGTRQGGAGASTQPFSRASSFRILIGPSFPGSGRNRARHRGGACARADSARRTVFRQCVTMRRIIETSRSKNTISMGSIDTPSVKYQVFSHNFTSPAGRHWYC